jgi:hypothetical protein
MYKTESEAREAALALSRKDNLSDDAYVAIYQPSIDAFLIYAKVSTLLYKCAKTGTYAGKTAVLFRHDDHGGLISAQTTVRRLVMDSVQEFQGDQVYLSEYTSSKWHTEKPHMFLAKTALAVALRQAFPDVLSGLVAAEEAACELDFGHTKTAAKSSKVVQESDFDVITPIAQQLNDSVSVSAKVQALFGGVK